MAYASNEPQSIPTLAAALQNQTVDNLKKFAALVNDAETKPARKADLIAFILRHTDGELGRLRQVEDDPLQALWRKLDAFQQAAVAETVHGPDSRLDVERFQAKYGRAPDLSKVDLYTYRQPISLLSLFIHDGIMPDDLRRRFKSFVPKPEPVRLSPQNEIPAEWTLTDQEWDEKTRKRKACQRIVPIAQRLTERAAVHDLKAILRLIDAGKLAVSDKTLQPGAAALRTLDALLLGGDFYDDSGYGEYEKIGPIKPFAWPVTLRVRNCRSACARSRAAASRSSSAITNGKRRQPSIGTVRRTAAAE